MEDPTLKLQRCLQKFIDHVDQLENEDDPAGNGFHKEYRVLRDLASKNKEDDVFPTTVGKLPFNIKKNRYRDIVPYDSTRVTLKELPDAEGTDYINASFIAGANGRAAYIASQGPLPHTLNDFWRMLWEYKVKVVVMVCREVEMGKKKCASYWPENVGEELTFNDINVKLLNQLNIMDADDCIERCMTVSKGDEAPFRVIQFHYTGWPDHGIPDDEDVILTMVAKMRAIRASDKEFCPAVVHCSAGCGRTGTICAIDYAWELLKTGRLDEDFSLYDIIKSMREQRQSMIQTPEQYMMAHLAIKDLFTKHMDVIQENIYANVGEGEDEYVNKLEHDKSEVEEVESSDTYSYVEPQKLLEREVLSAVEVYTNPMNQTVNSKPPLSPKPKPLEPVKQSPVPAKRTSVTSSPKGERTSITSSPKGEKKRQSTSSPKTDKKRMSPIAAKRSSKKITEPKVEQERTQGKETDPEKQPKQSYTNVFLGEKYTNYDVPESGETQNLRSSGKKEFSPPPKTPPADENVPPPKPSLQRKVSAPKSNINQPPGGPKFFSTGGGSPNTAPSGPKFVSSINIGSGGIATNLPPTSVNKVNKPVEQKMGFQQESAYSLAANVNTPSHKLENSGPTFVQTHQSTSNPPAAQGHPVGGAVYTEVKKTGSSISEQSGGAQLYSQVNKSSGGESRTSANSVVGSGSSVYETIGTNGEYRPKPDSLPKKGARDYEEVSLNSPDGIYSVAEPVETSPDAPPIPNRAYLDTNDNESKDPVKSAVEMGTGTFGRFKDKFFKSGGTSDTNVDTSNIPGFKKRLDKKPKGKREKPGLWNKILR